jgi:molybdopterin-guanine dinucleotide biosynthesis protein A
MELAPETGFAQMESVPHTAALLAGGKSSRMGRDKAALIVEGVPLWQRQLDVLRKTGPAALCISGPLDGAYAGADAKIMADATAGQGPLGGLATVLLASENPWVLVLAVDLPFMRGEYLRQLVTRAEQTGRGVVPVHFDGRPEPLAAVYPRSAGALAGEFLFAGERRLAAWVARLEAIGALSRLPIVEAERGWFANWNRPEDMRPGGSSARESEATAH